MNVFRLLLVDDEEDLRDILSYNLTQAGYEVTVCASAEEALKLNLSTFHLFVLDVMMRGMNGFELSEAIRSREETKQTPIVFLSAFNREENIVKGFHTGADDYIGKPFSMAELRVRIAAILRRAYESTTEEKGTQDEEEISIEFEGLTLDLRSMHCLINNEEVTLTRKEMQILELLIRRIDTVVSREELLRKVWSENQYVMNGTINVCITRLRKKLGTYGGHLVSRVGVGYGFMSRRPRLTVAES